MYNPLKKVIAILASVAIFAISTTSVSAKTFNDVPENAWYYEYVEQLVSDGVIESTSYFYPNTAQKREELIKWVIIATDGLKEYEEPVTPTFDDVPINSPYYQFIEAAVQLGIVIGYTDDYGNPLAKFGPRDNVTRAEATKILVKSFEIPTKLEITSSFSDVKKSHWYHDFVMTAYNYSILDGYENGKFGPGDPITKSQMAKLIANAKNPVIRTTTKDPSPTEEISEEMED